jgi:histidyl-tRNA synthetase
MKQADRVGARYVAILYPDGTVLRDMDSGDEEQVERDSVVAAVLKGRHEL